jgi:hypothetical protein
MTDLPKLSSASLIGGKVNSLLFATCLTLDLFYLVTNITSDLYAATLNLEEVMETV